MLGSESTGRSCIVCKVGTVVRIRVFVSQNIPATEKKIRKVNEYHCDNCGIMYAFPPPPANNLANKGS